MFRVRAGALQETAILPNDFIGFIACQVLEGLVGKDDGVIGQAGIGDEHRHGRQLNCRRERIRFLGKDVPKIFTDGPAFVANANPTP